MGLQEKSAKQSTHKWVSSGIARSGISGIKRTSLLKFIWRQAFLKEIILQACMDGFLIVDSNGMIVSVNKGASDILGYGTEKLTGMNISDIEAQETPESTVSHIRKAIRKGSDHFETKHRRQDGSVVDVEISTYFVNMDEEQFFVTFFRDITERKCIIRDIKKRKAELERKTSELEAVNTALKILLKRRDEDKAELEKAMISNVKQLIMPYLNKLKEAGLDSRQKVYLSLLELHIDDIISPFAYRLSYDDMKLTPAEIQIADLIRCGRTSKEIAVILNLSVKTIESHRRNIRRKVGINKTKRTLKTRLLSLRHP